MKIEVGLVLQEVIKKGDRIAQGMFINFLLSDNGNSDEERVGGFGSTNK